LYSSEFEKRIEMEIKKRRLCQMKKLVIVRHGDYGFDGSLSTKGKAQMKQLAESLRSQLGGGKTIILFSTAPRGEQSARILAAELGITELEPHEVLWSDRENGRSAHPAKTLALVRSKKELYDIVVLVTHYEYAEEFPMYFSQCEFDGLLFICVEIKKAEAWVIDCETRQRVRVKPQE
jgi:phosphohistidine phosphatase SixA